MGARSHSPVTTLEGIKAALARGEEVSGEALESLLGGYRDALLEELVGEACAAAH